MTFKMPEPVGWVRRHPDGALTTEYLENEVIEPVRKNSGAWVPLVPASQLTAAYQQGLDDSYNAMFTAKGCKACRFDAQTAIRSLGGADGGKGVADADQA